MYYWASSRHHIQATNTCGVIVLMYLLDFPMGIPEGFSKRAMDAKDSCRDDPSIQPWYVAFLPWISKPTPTSWMLAVQVRPWLFVVLGLIYPLYVFAILPFVVRRRRKLKGLCIHCAYDLTGNQSGICPECGTRTAPAQNPGNPSPPS